MKKKYIIFSLLLLGLLLSACQSNDQQSSEIKMRVQDGYIQYYTGSDWNNVIEVDELKGEKGDKGDKGEQGDPGIDGINGINGKDGIDGTNGKDGIDAENKNYITKEFEVAVFSYGPYPDSTKNYASLVITNQEKVESLHKTYAPMDTTKLRECLFYMNEDGKVEVEAKAEEDWEFVEWSDGVTSPKRTITYDDEELLVATFKYKKEILTYPTMTHYEVDYISKDLTIEWKEVKNIINYTVIFNNEEYTCNTNSLTVNIKELDMEGIYDISITPNPIDESKYKARTSKGIVNLLNYMYVNQVPEFESNTKLDDYKTKLKEAGFGLDGSYGEININYITDGATSENNNTVVSVSPKQGTKAYVMRDNITISVYKYNQ